MSELTHKEIKFLRDFKAELAEFGFTPEEYEKKLKMIRDKVHGDVDLDWPELKEMCDLSIHSDCLRKACSQKPFGSVYVSDYLMHKAATDSKPNTYLEEIERKTYELDKAREKLATEKIERNRWTREDARDELIAEKIADAIGKMPPLEKPDIVPKTQSNDRAGVLLIADAHYGTEFTIKGLFGETLNEYSPEIFERRMWGLLEQVVGIVKKEGFTTLNVFCLGDECEGLLRVSQLMKLRYGVIESAIKFSRFLIEWLNELSKHVNIRFQITKDSNHNQIRLLGEKKNSFPDENVSYIIIEKILDKLSGNPNFEFIQNETGMVFDTLVGFSLLGIHGEVKNLAQAIKDFSATYKVNLSYLVGGHFHHGATEVVGINSEVIAAPSLIGVDSYSLSLRKTSNPGATLFVLERDLGKTIQYDIKL